jgi:hypothetical protein
MDVRSGLVARQDRVFFCSRDEPASVTQGARYRADRLHSQAIGQPGPRGRRIDRCFYELCVLSELKNALRAGDIWVQGSRQSKEFEAYLLPLARFAEQCNRQELGLAVDTDCETFLTARLATLSSALETVESLAAQNELPDAAITIASLKNHAANERGSGGGGPAHAASLRAATASEITELLLEVDTRTGFTRHFTHLKNGEPAPKRTC